MPREAEQDIALLRQYWRTGAPPARLAARIVSEATRLPQHRPWHARVNGMVRQFGEWNAAMAYQAAALAACAIVGIYTAQMTQTEDIDLNSVVIADNGWTEGL